MEKYTKSIVVFLDILGFSKRIENSKNENDVTRVFDILKYIKAWNTTDGKNPFIEIKDFIEETYIDINKLDFEKIQNDLQISYFSDTLLITLPYDDSELNEKLFLVIRELVYLINKLAGADFFTRGGIAIGDMFHENNIFFGPAYLKAYKLESEVAHYPRIVLSRELSEKINFQNMPYISEYEDGMFGIDCFSFVQQNSIISVIKNNVSINLKNVNDEKVFSLYKWLEKRS